MAAVFTPLRRVWDLMSPSKAAAPQATDVSKTQRPNPVSPPVPQVLEQDNEQDYEPILEQSTPRSLFSNKTSEYMPRPRRTTKRKFELDFDSPQIAKKARMEAEERVNSKRKREFEYETPQKKPKSTNLSQTMPPMPRSAMKARLQPRTPTTTLKKNVTFNRQPLTETKMLVPVLGHAGQYNGSIFADASPLSPSSPDVSPSAPSTISDACSSQLEMSPTTKSNTSVNTPGARTAFCHDPHDPYWRPQPHNPRPGQFCLPDDLSMYDEEGEESIIESTTPTQANTAAIKKNPATPDAQLPASPETPRLSHAQLPPSPSKNTPAPTLSEPPTPQSSFSTPPITGIVDDSSPDAVTKARAAAEKYKPASVGKQASKLSQVTQARSRSSSPPPTGSRPSPSTSPEFAFEDQLDQWAQNLAWPQPGEKLALNGAAAEGEIEEVFNSDMMRHILREWTAEDDEQSDVFWEREFGRVVDAGRRAEREGKTLMFV